MAGPPGAARIHNLRRLLWPHGRDHDPRLLQEAAADRSEVRSGEPLHDLLLLLWNGGDGNFFDSLQVQLVAASRDRQISKGATFSSPSLQEWGSRREPSLQERARFVKSHFTSGQDL